MNTGDNWGLFNGDIGYINLRQASYEEILEFFEKNLNTANFTFNEEEGVIDVIDEITNDYEAGNTWVYLLNDQMADMGVVSQTLSEGDDIKWYFGTIDQIPITIIPADDEVAEEAVTAEDEEQVEVVEDTEE